MLRDYQLRAIESARDARRRGKRAILLVSPTGSGKSVLGSAIVSAGVAKGGRWMWLAHRAELIDQGAKHLRKCGLRVGIVGKLQT